MTSHPAAMAALVVSVLCAPGIRAQPPGFLDGPAAGTWILQIEGDARDLAITAAVHKPHPWSPPADSATDVSIRLRDAAGRVLLAVPVDLARFCADPDHAGDAPHVRGDMVVAHRIVTRVKVPALAAAVEARIERNGEVLGRLRRGEPTRVLAEPEDPIVKTIRRTGPESNRFDIVVLGDGYRAAEEALFDQDAEKAIASMFAHPVYAAYSGFFNVHTVFRASVESGADHPNARPPIFRNTVYDATYDYNGTPRCLYIQDPVRAAADALYAPDVDASVMVLVNDNAYGGCGGAFAVSYTGPLGPEVQTHEFGHSFGALADEYDTGGQPMYFGLEPAPANVTADPTGATKWPLWIGTQGVGLFEGALLYKKGIWRPTFSCLMRDLGAPLCAVCNEQIVLQCHTWVSGLDRVAPAAGVISVQKPGQPTLTVASLIPSNAPIEWRVDGQLVASGGTSFTWDPSALPSGRYAIEASQLDETALVRKDPSGKLTSRAVWQIDLLSTDPGTFATFGEGCAGSRIDACIASNEFEAQSGSGTLPGLLTAIEVTAPADMLVAGFELSTASSRPGTAVVDVKLFDADATGGPGRVLRSGQMRVGEPLAWYGVSFEPYPVRAGDRFFIAYRQPRESIASPASSGVSGDYWFAIGGDQWLGPRQNSFKYRVRCAPQHATVPSLAGSGFPEIGSAFDLHLRGAVADALALLLLGRSRERWGEAALPLALAAIGAPGCALEVEPEVLLPVQANAMGDASVTIAIPPDADLFGAELFAQFGVQDAAANALGYAFTNGGVARIGR